MLQRLKFYFLLSFIAFKVSAQDPQLSQYYNSPLFLNPALAGTAENSRAVLNYRSQWTSLPSPYVSIAASFDHFIGPYNSGVGLLVKRDRQGEGRLNATDINLIYSYHVYVGEKYTFVPALQVGYAQRNVNFSNFIFGDQLSTGGLNGMPTSDGIVADGGNVSFLDFSAGGIFYSDVFWIGYSAHHLNKPNEAFAGTSSLPVKNSLHAGYKIFLSKPSRPGMQKGWSREKSIIPTFMYKLQGLYDQLDVGVYGIYDPFMFGLWYRGIPVKQYKEGVNNHEALIFLAGIHYQGLSFAYSYDLTISSLRPGSGGSHEISLIYEWEIPYNNYKKKKRARKVSCPKFYN